MIFRIKFYLLCAIANFFVEKIERINETIVVVRKNQNLMLRITLPKTLLAKHS